MPGDIMPEDVIVVYQKRQYHQIKLYGKFINNTNRYIIPEIL